MPTHPSLYAAITGLRAVCDGAHAQDFRGFSATDAPYGHRLADSLTLDGREATPEEQLVMLDKLTKYRAQLATMNVTLPTHADLCAFLGYEEPVQPTDEMRARVLDQLQIEEIRRTRGNGAAAAELNKRERAAKAKAEAAAIAEAPDATVTLAGTMLEIIITRGKPKAIDQFGAVLQAIKGLPVRSYRPEPRPHWSVPVNFVAQVTAALSPFIVTYADDVTDAATAAALAPPAPSAQGPSGTSTGANLANAPGIIRVARKGVLAVDFPYNAALVDKARKIKGRRWQNGTNECPMSSLAQILATFPDFARAPEIAEIEAEQARLAREAEEQARQRRASRASTGHAALSVLGDLEAPFKYAPPGLLPETRTLFAHQREGIRRMIEEAFLVPDQRGAINADDMGLGKTLQALIAARAIRDAFGTRTIVVCPVSLQSNWIREASAIGMEIEVYSASKIPPPPACAYVLIADEAHLYQTWGRFTGVFDPDTGKEKIRGTQRTAKFLRLADGALATFPLTGTPMRNGRPAEAFPLLYAIRHEFAAKTGDVAKDKRAYEAKFCGARQTRFSQWDITGAAHMDEWHAGTRGAIIRRLKKECLDMPEKTRVFRDVEISKDAAALYQTTVETKAGEYYARVEEGKRQRAEIEARYALLLASCEESEGDDLERERDRELKNTFSEEGEALVFLTHVRNAASLAKVEGAIDLAEQILAEGRQVVLFTDFATTAKALAEHFKVPALTGETKNDDRQGLVDAFQNGSRRVFVGTCKAGGVGITLHANGNCADVILVDRPWTPGDAIQAEDRVHRIGQRSNVTAHWLSGFEICHKIDEILLSKSERIELLLAGKRKTLRGVRQMSTRQLAAELLPMFLPERA